MSYKYQRPIEYKFSYILPNGEIFRTRNFTCSNPNGLVEILLSKECFKHVGKIIYQAI